MKPSAPNALAPTASELEALLREHFQPHALQVIDDSAAHAGHAGAASGGGHYRVHMRSARLAGLGRLAQHRLVYDALGPSMGTRIHALALDLGA